MMESPNTTVRTLPALAIAAAMALFIAQPATAQTAGNVKCNGCVNSRDVKNNGIKSKDIKDGQVRNADLGEEAVDGAKVQDESLTSSDVQDGSLTSVDILDQLLFAETIPSLGPSSREIIEWLRRNEGGIRAAN